MYRLLKSDNLEAVATLAKSWSRRPILCDLCNHCLQNKAGIHLANSEKAQYISALKHLLSKKSKKAKKSKRFVEVMKGTLNSVTSETTSVDVIRGKKLSALTSQLVLLNAPAQSVHTSAKRLYPVDSTRHYDPLLILPVENPNEFVDSLLLPSVDRERTRSLSPRAKPKASSYTYNLQSNILSAMSVPDIINQFKDKSRHEKSNSFVPIGKKGITQQKSVKYLEPKIQDLHKINVSGDTEIAHHRRLELRRKLRVLPLEELRREAETSPSCTGDDEALEFSESIFSPSVFDDDIKSAEPATTRKKESKKKKASYTVSLKKKTREIIAKQKLTDLQRCSKKENLNANFLSYCDVCVSTGTVNDAFFAIKSYRRKIAMSKDWHPTITDIEVYNRVIAGFAQEGNWQKISDLLKFAEEDKLSLNPQSYAGILDCLGRKRIKNPSHIQDLLEKMKTKNIGPSDVLNQAELSLASRDRVLAAIRTVHPSFQPAHSTIDRNYDCPLLNHLNHQSADPTSPAPHSLTAEEIKSLYNQQMAVEKENYVKIKTVEHRSESTEGFQVYREKLAEAQKQWKETVENAFDRDLEVLMLQSKHRSHFFFTIYPYLMTIPKEEHVEIIMQEIRKLAEGSETYSPTTKQLYRELGAQVCLRYQIKKKDRIGALRQMDELFNKYCDWYVSPDQTAANTRQKWQLLLQDHDAVSRLCGAEPLWRSHVLTGVGRFLYNIIIRDVKVDVNIMRPGSKKERNLPAFYTLFRSKGHISKEEVKPHPTLSRLFRAAAPEHLVFEASKIPMVCPPLPWTSATSGGYLVTKTELIRLPFQAVAQWKELETTPVNKLYPAFDSLNQLGAVPWAVNNQVLDVILNVFNSGGSAKLDVPEPPSACPPADSVTPEMTPQERSQIFRQRITLRRRRAEMYSLWCDALYKLSLANHFRNRIFWLPHNMDFRGRVYPVAPHLNHLGSDLSRSLLIFAKGEPLGADGFDWLKIHTINLTGTHKKKSVQERLDYANTIIDDIIDSAEKPLTGKMWWGKSEEPWQTLAACMEVRNAFVSGDPANYVSQFPVHQDGSCNGLQHYAALGRDLAGGESVNLTPAAVPQDVYSCVATIVERERAKDAANGVEIAQQLEGFIYRKVIKQTVMTTVYGVTRFGARLQIARQLKDIDDFPKQHVWQASMYLVNKTFESLQEMFTSTKEIQDWFTECARLIAQVCGENVRWITPLGLPIVQPYVRNVSNTSTIDHLKFIGVQASTLADAFERPNIMKQKNAFAPNFIHSLDSSHMMLTSVVCERQGVTFVSVHDCYWTHARSVPAMNRACRAQFVALHSQPILADLSKYFEQRFAYCESSFFNDGSIADLARRNLNRVLRDLPSTGSLDLQAVLKSPYFFS